MATKSTYLTLINKVLKRINQSTVVSVPSTGHGGIIAELINEAQNYLYTEVNWYSLYATRTWKTYQYTASTIAFNSGGTITDSANGLGNFPAGCMVYVTGTANNNYAFQVGTSAAGTLTLTSDELVTTEAAGNAVTLTQMTYPTASDFGRGLSLQDLTSNRILVEDVVRDFDAEDPNLTTTGTPTNFAIDGNFYRLYPIPSGAFRYRENYLKTPAALAATTDTSALPIECENPMIHYAFYQMLQYLQKYDAADRERAEFEKQLARAKASNFKVINQLHRMMSIPTTQDGIAMPRFPASYGPRYGV